MSMVCSFVVVLWTAVPAPPPPFTPEVAKQVRQAVYQHSPRIETDRQTLGTFLDVPDTLRKQFQCHTKDVSALLLKIMEGGNPIDSVTAAAYAIELTSGPGAGVVVVELFSAKTYDDVDRDWETTSRQHWINRARRLMGR